MRISQDTAHDNLMKVFEEFADNNNENNELWKVIPTKDCQYHINVDCEQCCYDPKCEGRNEKKYTKEFNKLWATRMLLFRLLDRYYEEMREERRLGREPRRLDF